MRDEYIERVEVRLEDINGPKGGKDICCRIRVLMRGMRDVIIRDVESELMTAIDRAADRVGRTVSRKIERKLTLSRAINPEYAALLAQH